MHNRGTALKDKRQSTGLAALVHLPLQELAKQLADNDQMGTRVHHGAAHVNIHGWDGFVNLTQGMTLFPVNTLRKSGDE